MITKIKIKEWKKIYDKTPKSKQKHKEYYQSIDGIYTHLRSGAKARKIEFSITQEEFITWYNNQEKKCYYCGIDENKLNKYRLFAMHYTRLTIDRKNNNKGYNLNNIVLACGRCNSIKSDFFTEQEMLKIGKIAKQKRTKGIKE